MASMQQRFQYTPENMQLLEKVSCVLFGKKFCEEILPRSQMTVNVFQSIWQSAKVQMPQY